MAYFLTASQRKNTHSTLYFEFQKGRFNRRFWQANSIYLHADIFDRLGLYDLFSEIIADFCYFADTQISPIQYASLKSTAFMRGGEIAVLFAELDIWVVECFKTESCFTILGI